jgi:SPP1 family predicted phage head-tail adaptor
MPGRPPIFIDPDFLVIDPAELHNFITIEAGTGSTDALGGSVTPTTWETVLSTWAAIFTPTGREFSQPGQLVSQISHIVKIRFPKAVPIRSNYRVAYRSRHFRIQYVENVKERDFVLLLYCLEIDSGGGGGCP